MRTFRDDVERAAAFPGPLCSGQCPGGCAGERYCRDAASDGECVKE